MTDLQTLQTLVAKCQGATAELLTRGTMRYREHFDDSEWTPSLRTMHVLRVNPGYRAHFEAEFDDNGSILSIGQWESL